MDQSSTSAFSLRGTIPIELIALMLLKFADTFYPPNQP